jgi:hypothetical protein
VAEYEALVNGLRITAGLRIQRIYIRVDSELVVNQVMGESNYHDSRMAAYRQEVIRLEEKFDGFKHHHVLQRNNEATDALTLLGSCCESPPLGVFVQDLFKPSIRIGEDTLTRLPGGSPNESSSTPMPGTPPGESNIALIPEASLEASAGPIAPNPGPAGEVATVVRPPSLEADWQKPIAEYLRLGMIPDDEYEIRCLARRAKGYLIHNNELY